jgi:hypothetical protein
MSTYNDPSDDEMKLVYGLLKNAKNSGEVLCIINETFPSWICFTAEKYSNDYEYLQKNWESICKKLSTTPKSIICVDEITRDERHSLLQIFCERLTIEGFVVRCKGELIRCSRCGNAIPGFKVYECMHSKSLPIPDKYSIYCSSC